MLHCLDFYTDDNGNKQTCMKEKEHAGYHEYVPDRFIKYQYGINDTKPTIIIIKQLSKDNWL